MLVETVKTPIIEPGQRLIDVFKESRSEPLKERSVVCVTSKVVSVEQRRIVNLDEVKVSPEAAALKSLKYSKDFDRYPGLAELILRESDFVYEGQFVYLTLKNGMFIPNAGIDLSNVRDGYAILWPLDPWGYARRFRDELRSAYGVNELGVLITDSRCTPLRKGVIGLAMAYSGFEGVESHVGRKDLFGRELHFTNVAVADDLACAAVLLMGESSESTPFAVIQDGPITFTDREIDPNELNIEPEVDLFAGLYGDKLMRSLRDPKRS